MAAPSVGRRSCAEQREAAALISQSRRKVVWACQMGCCTTAFFLLPSSGSKHLFLVYSIQQLEIIFLAVSAHFCKLTIAY